MVPFCALGFQSWAFKGCPHQCPNRLTMGENSNILLANFFDPSIESIVYLKLKA